MIIRTPQYLNYDMVLKHSWFWKPIELTKYLIVSWRMSGSEFSKEVIAENFPQCQNYRSWGKSHGYLPDDILRTLKNIRTKIFFIICDPRDAITHILNHDNGAHYHPDDYPDHINQNRNELIFLDENLKIIINLLEYYQSNFGKNLIVLRYEDAVNNQEYFLKQVGQFLYTEPLYVNDKEKYNNPIYKKIGVYPPTFNNNVIKRCYENSLYAKKKEFFKKWGYLND